MMIYQPQLLCDGFLFPEVPRWHRGSFYCCSIDEGSVFRIGNNGSKEVVIKIDDWLGGWVFTDPDSDEMLITSARKRKLLRWDGSGEPTEFSDLSEFACFSINDMVRTRNGVSFVGGVDFVFGTIDHDKVPQSPLLRVDAQGKVSIASGETGFPNGMVITPDDKYLIMADTRDHLLRKWELSENDELGQHSMYASLHHGSEPDGMCLDATGRRWPNAVDNCGRQS